jgi:hypothetical protein
MARPRPQRHRIPFGRHSTHFAGIQNSLALVLYEIKAVPALSKTILWVSCRLNRTGTIDSPIFVGWVEDVQAIRIRVQKGHLFAPIDIRFGDTHRPNYIAIVKGGAGRLVPESGHQNRKVQGVKRSGKTSMTDSSQIGAIKIKGYSVGTLNAAFQGDPAAQRTRTSERSCFIGPRKVWPRGLYRTEPRLFSKTMTARCRGTTRTEALFSSYPLLKRSTHGTEPLSYGTPYRC